MENPSQTNNFQSTNLPEKSSYIQTAKTVDEFNQLFPPAGQGLSAPTEERITSVQSGQGYFDASSYFPSNNAEVTTILPSYDQQLPTSTTFVSTTQQPPLVHQSALEVTQHNKPGVSELAQTETGNPAVDIARGLASGKPPSNLLINQTIDSTKETIHREGARTADSHTAKTARDAEAVLTDWQQLLAEKNRDEKLQQFILDVREVFRELGAENKKARHTKQRTKKREHDVRYSMGETAEHLIALVRAIITSREFRSFILDFIRLAEETAQNEKNKSNIYGARAYEAPTTTTTHYYPTTATTNGLVSGMENLSVSPVSTTAAGFHTTTVPTTGYTDQTIDEAARLKTQEARSVGGELRRDFEEGTLPIPEYRKQDVSRKFRLLVEKLGDNPSYHSAMNGLFFIFKEMQLAVKQSRLASQPTTAMGNESVSYDPKRSKWMHKLLLDAKAIVAEFCGEEILNCFYDDIWELYLLVKEDQAASLYWSEVKQFLATTIRNPKLLNEELYIRQSEDLYNRGRIWANDPRYKERYHRILDHSRCIMESFREDTIARRLAIDTRMLAEDLVLDEHGNPSLEVTREGLVAMKALLLPVLRQHLESIPIPKIEGSDEKYEYSLEGLVLSGRDLVPDHIHIYGDNDTSVNLETEGEVSSKTHITLHINNINVHAKGFKFYYKRKHTPKIEDHGVADLDIYGKGTEVILTWKVKSKQGKPMRFKVKEVRCNIDKLRLHIQEAKHNVVDKMVAPLVSSIIKKTAERRIEESLRMLMERMNIHLNEVVYKRYLQRHEDKSRKGIATPRSSTEVVATPTTTTGPTPAINVPGGTSTPYVTNTQIVNNSMPTSNVPTSTPVVTQDVSSTQQYLPPSYFTSSVSMFDRQSPFYASSSQAFEASSTGAATSSTEILPPQVAENAQRTSDRPNLFEEQRM